MGGGGGLAVSDRAFYSNNLSSNATGILFIIILQKGQRGQGWPISKSFISTRSLPCSSIQLKLTD